MNASKKLRPWLFALALLSVGLLFTAGAARATWQRVASPADDTRQFAVYEADGSGGAKIAILTAAGTLVRTLTTASRGFLGSPSWSPDEKKLAYVTPAGLVVQPASGGAEVILVPSGVDATAPKVRNVAWSPSGDTIAYWTLRMTPLGSGFLETWLLMAIAPDGSNSRTLAGPFSFDRYGSDPTQLASRVDGHLAWSPDGRSIMFERGASTRCCLSGGDAIVSVPASGGATTVIVPALPDDYLAFPVLAPDGTHMSFLRIHLNGFAAISTALVVRDLSAGNEKTIAVDACQTGGHCPIFGPASWSVDGASIAYADTTTNGPPLGRIVTTPADGSPTPRTVYNPGHDVYQIARTNQPPPPNLYIDRVEVAQALSPLGSAPAFPMQADPEAAVNNVHSDTHDTLVEGRDTFVRVYIADQFKKDAIVPEFKVRLSVSKHGVEIGRVDKDVKDFEISDSSALDRQAHLFATVNFVVPRAWTTKGTVDFSVVLDPDGVAHECAGCEKQGNVYNVQNIPFELGGTLRLFPWKFEFVWPHHHSLPPNTDLAIPDHATPLLPVSSRGVVQEPWQGTIVISTNDPLYTTKIFDGKTLRYLNTCDVMSAKIAEREANVPFSAGGVVNRVIGYFAALPPVDAPEKFNKTGCLGAARRPGYSLIVGVYRNNDAENVNTFAHELGHSVGLDHADCPTPVSPYDPAYPVIKLPYTGIDGVGYRAGGPDGLSLVQAGSEDLMSYCEPAWTSPVTWETMFTELGGEFGTRFAKRSRSAAAKTTTRPQLSRHLTAPGRRFPGRVLIAVGAVLGGHAQIIETYTVAGGATLPPTPSAADTIARVKAVDGNGHRLASVAIAPTEAITNLPTTGAPQIFVAVLPIGTATPATITVNRPNGAVLTRAHRSKHAPVLKLTGLSRSHKVARHKPLALRWRAADADHDPLTYTVLLSARGRGFQVVASELRQPRTTLDLSPYKPGTTLRVRVVVSDGLRFTTATSPKLTVVR